MHVWYSRAAIDDSRIENESVSCQRERFYIRRAAGLRSLLTNEVIQDGQRAHFEKNISLLIKNF